MQIRSRRRDAWAASLTISAFAFAGAVASAAPAKPAAPAATRTTGKAGADLPERIIEKRDGEYTLRLTIRPGNSKVDDAAEGEVELLRNLEVPDPETGDVRPVANATPVAQVKAPEGARGKGGTALRYRMWPATNPGTYSFHFTPTEDGIYEVTISAQDTVKTAEETELPSMAATFRVGAGTAAAQTEQSQGATSQRRSSRRPIGDAGGDERERKLVRLMHDIGESYLHLSAGSDRAAEAKAIADLFAQVKGLVPDSNSDNASEFDAMASGAASSVMELVPSGKGAKTKSLESFESVSCDRCHAKFRFEVTTNVSNWPKFSQRAAQ